MKKIFLVEISFEIVPKAPIENGSNSSDGLVPSRWQTISLTKYILIQWRIYTSPA